MERNSGEFLLVARRANKLKSYLGAFMTEYIWKYDTTCFHKERRNMQRSSERLPCAASEQRDAGSSHPAAPGMDQNPKTLSNPPCCIDRNR